MGYPGSDPAPPAEPHLAEGPSPLRRWSAEDRHREHPCTGCGHTITRDQTAHRVAVSRYAPIDNGPEWECVGDWTPTEAMAGTVCALCLETVQAVLMGRRR